MIIINLNLAPNQTRAFTNLEQLRQWLHGNLENGGADGASVFDGDMFDPQPKFALRYCESCEGDGGSAWEVSWFIGDEEDETFETDDEAVERFVELVSLDRQGA